MASFLEKIISDDFIWDAITGHIHGTHRQKNGFLSSNCVMCVSRGETADRRQRLGIKRNEDGSIGVSCFNCGFKTKFVPGTLISTPMQELLLGLGMSETEVKKLNYRAFSYRSILTASPDAMALVPTLVTTPQYEAKPLPIGSRKIEDWANEGFAETDFLESVEYLFTRGDDIVSNYTYYWSPDKKFRRHIIIPFYHEGKTVGFTARAIDKESTRYHMEAPTDFLFNYRALLIPDRRFAILAEGVFDAIAIDSIGLMGAHLNSQQIAFIKSSGKKIILIPDRDKQGERMIDTALLNNFSVAFPAMRSGHGRDVWWESDVKDAAEACKRYGRLYTLQSIIATATDNKIKINMLRKNLY